MDLFEDPMGLTRLPPDMPAIIYDREERQASLLRDLESKRESLWWALRSRVLTEEEMEEVRRCGSSLNVRDGVSYYAEEKSRELGDALYNQARLQLLAMYLKQGGDPASAPESLRGSSTTAS